MTDEASVRASFRWQADFCRASGAPILGAVCDALADGLDRTTATGARVLDWPGAPIADALPLRLCGGLHAMARSGAALALAALYRGAPGDVPAAVRACLADNDEALLPWLDGPPQTNEPARSGVLMGGLLALADRLGDVDFELLEIGSSAGLNLLIDRYAFDLGSVRAGREDAPITIAPEWRGPPPPSARTNIVSVRGVDIAPLDLRDDNNAERILSFVWPDQHDRLARTARAIALARAHPPRLEQGDAADWIEARLADPQQPGTARVLMHSIVWQYLPPATQARIEAAMAAAGTHATPDRPLGWITYEGERDLGTHALTIRAWPGKGIPHRLATAHPHGAWIDWVAPSS